MKFEDIEYLIPQGWAKAFGQMLVDEINAVAPESEVLDAKEKWGSLRLELQHNHDYETVDRIVDKYSHLSENICTVCGKPDIHMIDDGWVYPICENCYKQYYHTKPYEEVIVGEGRMDDSYTINRWTDDGYSNITYDISETAEKIREKWRNDNEHLHQET